MRILQIVQKPERRGAEIFAYQLSEHFLREGHQVKTVYLYPSSEGYSLPLRDGDLIIGNEEFHFSEKLPGWNLKILQRLRTIVRKFQPDIIQLNAGRSVKYGTLLRLIDRGRWILIYRNIGDPSVWLAGRWRRWLYRVFLMPRVDGMVAVSSASLKVLKSFYGETHQMIHIPRAVDPNFFEPKMTKEAVREKLSTPLTAPVMIFVGSLTFEKRVDRLLRVLLQNIRTLPELHFWIVGNGRLQEQLEAEALKLGVAPSVRFVGSQEDVASYVNAADLLVLSSDTEGIPGVVLEAALLGIPSVASRIGGVPDCIIHGETGLLVDPRDEVKFAAATAELILQSEKRLELGSCAKEYVTKKFNMHAIAAEYIQFYRKISDAKQRMPQ